MCMGVTMLISVSLLHHSSLSGVIHHPLYTQLDGSIFKALLIVKWDGSDK